MVTGVTQGYEKKLEIVGVGYRVIARGQNLEFALGYSHPIVVEAPAGIAFAVESPTRFSVQGIDKQQVGEIAANIRKLRKPEPYKGKGIRYAGEQVRRKVGRLGRSNGYRDLRAQPSASRPGRRPRPPPPTSSKEDHWLGPASAARGHALASPHGGASRR